MQLISQTTSSIHYTTIESLLISAFPKTERRSLEQQREYTNNNSKFTVYAAVEKEKLVGFFTLWTFAEFCFVEHFAVFPQFRQQGYGSFMLQEIKEQVHIPIFLETEIPFSERQKLRQKFYEKNGFRKLEQSYFQPPYGANKTCFMMDLMMYGEIVAENADERDIKIYQYVKEIYKEVYSFTKIEDGMSFEYIIE